LFGRWRRRREISREERRGWNRCKVRSDDAGKERRSSVGGTEESDRVEPKRGVEVVVDLEYVRVPILSAFFRRNVLASTESTHDFS